MTGLMGAQAATGSWADMQNAAAAAASFYQRQAAGLTGSAGSPVSSFDPSSSSKIRGLPYRTSVRTLDYFNISRDSLLHIDKAINYKLMLT